MSRSVLRLAVRPLANSLAQTRNKIFAPKNLLYTNTIISGVLSIMGDVMQQYYQVRLKKERKGCDLLRTCRVGTSGLLIGPLIHYWYIFLDRWLPGQTLRVVVKKVLLDQLVCSPIYLALFLVSMGYMENKSASEFKDIVKEKGYRVLYDNTISMTSGVIWSYVWYEMDKHNKEMLVSSENPEDIVSD